jgi:uncharacterized protein (TIGR02246 family)
MAARRPEDIDPLFAQAFAAGDLDALVALYEPNAVMVLQGGEVVTGKDAVREALQGFLSLCGEFRLEVKAVVQSGDVALTRAQWSLSGAGPGGCVVNLSGRSIEVVRRQADGTWLYAVDDPFGAA